MPVDSSTELAFVLKEALVGFVAPEPVDLRKCFNGLHAIVLDQLREDPYSGHSIFNSNEKAISLTSYETSKRYR